MVALPQLVQEMTGLLPGTTVVLEIHTPERLLAEMGVGEHIINAIDLSGEQLIVLRKYHEIKPSESSPTGSTGDGG